MNTKTNMQNEPKQWKSSIVHQLVGDVGAAVASATLVAPAVTIIDRAIVEKSSLNQSLLRGLRSHTLKALKQPGKFVFQAPFGIIWALYAATYIVANGTDTISHEMKARSPGLMTFATTTLVNVPMGVWKDIRFAQIFGTQAASSSTDAVKTALVKSRGAARAATSIFLVRDSVTIFGSFTLAPKLAEAIPDSFASSPHAKPVITQLTVPVLTQLVATPLHLLGLDLYMRQHTIPLVDRLVQSQRYLASTTLVRCIRIVPAFGFGCLANLEMRSIFHQKLNV